MNLLGMVPGISIILKHYVVIVVVVFCVYVQKKRSICKISIKCKFVTQRKSSFKPLVIIFEDHEKSSSP